jgi:hypothetical protein
MSCRKESKDDASPPGPQTFCLLLGLYKRSGVLGRNPVADAQRLIPARINESARTCEQWASRVENTILHLGIISPYRSLNSSSVFGTESPRTIMKRELMMRRSQDGRHSASCLGDTIGPEARDGIRSPTRQGGFQHRTDVRIRLIDRSIDR